jgi:primase-polymerase (primpol)-like protein
MAKMNKIYAEISAGELVDKITILKIKEEKITNKKKLIEIKKELDSLTNTFNKSIKKNINLETLTKELKNINLKLWNIEDKKRELEKKQGFGKEFIELARNVYRFNDERAKIKLKINEALGSNIKEVKSYE